MQHFQVQGEREQTIDQLLLVLETDRIIINVNVCTNENINAVIMLLTINLDSQEIEVIWQTNYSISCTFRPPL